MDIYNKAAESLAVVRYLWSSELGPKDYSQNGVVIEASGVVAFSSGQIGDRIPDDQLKEITIVLPQINHSPLEFPAELIGRDSRSGLVYVKSKKPSPAFKPLTFSDAVVQVGDPIYCVGSLSKAVGYTPYLSRGSVASIIHGLHTSVIVDGSLGEVVSPIMDERGDVIGLASAEGKTSNSLTGSPETAGPPTFTLASDYLQSFKSLAGPATPIELPWLGLPQIVALSDEQRDYYGFTGAALQVVAVAPGSPAERAGIKPGEIITARDSNPLDEGQSPELTAELFARHILYMHPGDSTTLSVLAGRSQPTRSVSIQLAIAPPGPEKATRFWSDELGFGVREATYADLYQERLPTDGHGVVVCVIKPSAAAAASSLPMGAFVLQVNEHPVNDIASFKQLFSEQRKQNPSGDVVLLTRRHGNQQIIRIAQPN